MSVDVKRYRNPVILKIIDLYTDLQDQVSLSEITDETRIR